MVLQPGVGLGLLYNMPPGLSVPCSVSPFVYIHLSQVHEHVIQPSNFWSSSSSCCIQLSVQHLFWDCGVLHSFSMTKPSYSLAFNKPDNYSPPWLWLLIHRFVKFSIIRFLSLVHVFSARFSFQILLMLFPLPWWVSMILNHRWPLDVPMCGISAACSFFIWDCY